jgi:hypothetical protein
VQEFLVTKTYKVLLPEIGTPDALALLTEVYDAVPLEARGRRNFTSIVLAHVVDQVAGSAVQGFVGGASVEQVDFEWKVKLGETSV